MHYVVSIHKDKNDPLSANLWRTVSVCLAGRAPTPIAHLDPTCHESTPQIMLHVIRTPFIPQRRSTLSPPPLR